MNRDTELSQIRYSDFPKICRFCLKSDIVAPIFKQGQNHEQDELYSFMDIPILILTYTTLEVKPDDDLPMFLCKICLDKLIECQHFRQQCITTTKFLQKIKFEHKKIKCEKEDPNDNNASDIDYDVADDTHIVDNDDVSMDMVPFEQIYSEGVIKAETLDVLKQEEKETPKKKPRKKYTRRSLEEKQETREKRKSKIEIKKIKKEKKEKKEKKPPERYICQICGASVLNLNNHIQWMHMEKKYDIECDICGKKFYHFGRMKEHIRMVHIDERKYKCTICPNAFNAKYILVKHMRTHTGEKNFHCDMCERSFGARSTLKKHRLSHTQERKFACDHCDKRFARRDGLRNHVVIHTGDRPYKCGLCPMAFKFSSTASQHRKAHVNRQPYQCQPCGMDFKSIMLYRTHMKIHKEDEGFPNIDTMFQNSYDPQQLEQQQQQQQQAVEQQQQHHQQQSTEPTATDKAINNIVNHMPMVPFDMQQPKFEPQRQQQPMQYTPLESPKLEILEMPVNSARPVY